MRKTMKRSMLATMVALCCGTVAGQALAQEAAATAQGEADTTGKAAEPIELERVIATAQKRRENIMEVAAGISVISESRLESLNATRLTDFASYIPGFTVGNGDAPGMTSLALRGVAPLSGGATIASYIDDTPIGASGNKQRATSLSLDLLPYDVESIEVLRGPQGTLYGASAMGGLMKYVTKSADPDAFEFRAGTDINSVSGAGQLGTGVRTAFNVPLIEGRLGLRASFARQSTPGYIDEPALGKRDANGYSQLASRLALTWRISDNIDLRVQGLWQVVDADGTSQVGLDFNSHELLNGRFGGIAQVPESFRTETDYTAATLDWDLGWADFVSASSLSDTRSSIVTDETLAYGAYWPELGNYAPGLADFQIALSTHKWTQELRLNSKQSDRFEWLIGTFLTGEKHGNAQQVHAYDAQHRLLPFNPAAIVALPGTFREQALFADATYKFSPRFDISAGVRAARNKQSFSQLTDGVLFGERVDLQGDSDESVNTWKLATRWNLGEDAMLYARYATGYRPGGANVALPGIPRMTRSDTLTNLELGFKSHFWNRRAMIDAALFRIDWDDLQVGAASDEGIGYDANAGTARSNGIEVAFMLLPTERLTWGINAAYIDAELGNDVPASSGLRPGTRMPLTPRVSWSTTLDYAFELGGNWRGQLGGGYRYVGDRVGIRGVQYDPQKALDLHAEISNSTWTVRLYARNATDESTFTSKGEVSNVLGQNMLVIGTPVQPRTVGMSLDYRF